MTVSRIILVSLLVIITTYLLYLTLINPLLIVVLIVDRWGGCAKKVLYAQYYISTVSARTSIEVNFTNK